MSLMRKIVCALCAGYLAFIAGTAGANEAAIRKAFEAKFPKMTVESVTATPFAGIFEVVVEGQILYTDEKVSYMLSGNLLDMRGPQPRNLTQETTGKLNAAALAKSTTDSALNLTTGSVGGSTINIAIGDIRALQERTKRPSLLERLGPVVEGNA